MNTKTFKTVIVSATAAAILVGCSTGSTAEPSKTVTTPVAEVTTTEPAETVEPAETATTETVEPAETKVDVKKLKTGDKVPASQVKAARKAGVNVYVTQSGEGEVVERGTLPEVIKGEFEENFKSGSSQYKGSPADKMAAEAREAGVSVTIVHPQGGMYMVGVIIDGEPQISEGGFVQDGKDAAIALGKSLAKKYGTELLIIE